MTQTQKERYLSEQIQKTLDEIPNRL